MGNYLKESFKKFKADALAKGVYDLLKWLFVALMVWTLTSLFPKNTKFSEIVTYSLNISIYWIVISTVVIVIITLLVAYSIFKAKYKRVEHDNFTDELTGLRNHKALKVYLEKQLSEAEKDIEKSLSLILLDIDDFKQFNTEYGYITSDLVLKKLGELLSNDKRATDKTFRFYQRGDEFIIVASDTSARNALLAAERKRKLIQQTCFVVDENSFYLKVSCGVTEYKRGENYHSILNRVTSALNEAKTQKNKNCSKLII